MFYNKKVKKRQFTYASGINNHYLVSVIKSLKIIKITLSWPFWPPKHNIWNTLKLFDIMSTNIDTRSQKVRLRGQLAKSRISK